MIHNIDAYIEQALLEDINYEDITTNAIVDDLATASITLYSKEEGMIAGLSVFSRVFELLDQDITITLLKKDGDKIYPKDKLATIQGKVRTILTGERTALNFLQRMSGIATYTNYVLNLLQGTNIKVFDTRKTTPNMRIFEKYAVKIGGGYNHRYNLSDGILIKDNHIDAAGGITQAIEKIRNHDPYIKKIEVEVETISQVKEALFAKADIIMLDNMDVKTMKEAIAIINHQALIECSGNVTKESIALLKELNIDYISCGALTHSAPILDISLKNLVIDK